VSLTTTINYTSTTSKYYLIGYTSSPGTGTALSNVYARSTVYVDSNGYLWANKVYNAVWNDYAEYRQTDTI